MRRILQAAIALAFLLGASHAGAMFRVASDGKVGASAVHVLVERTGGDTRWIVAPELDGKAKTIALFFLVPSELQSAELATETLAEIERLTAPSLVEISAVDPCAPAEPKRDVTKVEANRTSTPNVKVERIDARTKQEARTHAQRIGVVLSPEVEAEIAAHSAQHGAVVVVYGALEPNQRRHALPPIAFSFRGEALALPIGKSAADAPPGADQRITVLSVADKDPLAPKGPRSVDMPSNVSFPAFAIESPGELARAIAAQTIRRELGKVIVRQAISKTSDGRAAGRWYFEQGRKSGAREPFVLAVDPTLMPFAVEWRFVHLWSQPVPCAIGERFLHNAKMEIEAELRVLATLTGRPLPDLVAEHRRRTAPQQR